MGGLDPLKNSLVVDFLDAHRLTLSDLLENHSSPLNILFPQVFIDNIRRFKEVFSDFGAREGIFYSAKANKGNAFVEAVAHANIGMEVSFYRPKAVSLYENPR
ncbi:MAG: hypothetical protein M1286_02770 [Candidatus Marsarchaeota archaeon]|nr:hypothetical protein [Candidatus Marsarchaeota archaeon]